MKIDGLKPLNYLIRKENRLEELLSIELKLKTQTQNSYSVFF
jgi:hypothetical protein